MMSSYRACDSVDLGGRWRGLGHDALRSFTLCVKHENGLIISDQILASVHQFDVRDPVVEVLAALEDAVLDRQAVKDQHVAFATVVRDPVVGPRSPPGTR